MRLIRLLVTVVRGTLVAIETARFALTARLARRTVLTLLTVRALLTLGAGLALVALLAIIVAARFGLGAFILFVALLIVHVVATLAPLVLVTGAAFAKHAVIVICELQIIFGLDTVAGELGVARHALVLLVKLSRVAALAIVLAVPRLSTEVPASALSPTTAPAAALTIVDQMFVLSSSC
jgi:hypothetical protein